MARDLILSCTECGIDFMHTIAQQEAEDAPARCPMCRLLAPAEGRTRGIVKWYNRSKGYGFITPALGPEHFLHRSGMAAGQPPPVAGQFVEFRSARSPRGVVAEDVVILAAMG